VIARGLLGTTEQAHIAGDVFSTMLQVITVCYGNSALVAPATLDANYDDTKPLFSLTGSSNTAWVYSASTLFWDSGGTGRTGGFTPAILARLGVYSLVYYFKNAASSGDPVMGMEIAAFIKGGIAVNEQAKLAFLFARGCGIDTTTCTGEKKRATTTWPTAALQYSEDGATYIDAWSEASPSAANAWEALATHSAVSMGSKQWMRFLFDGYMEAGFQNYAFFEIQTLTINFVSANLPSATLLSQQATVQVDMAMSNAANADALQIKIPMLVGLPLALDGEAKTIQYNDVNAHDVISLNDDSRDWWIRLQKGANDLTILAADVGTLAANLSWYRRRY
jgi:hypothetical protein